jgi:PadR family transcriptional regulator, regulatory protein PadR
LIWGGEREEGATEREAARNRDTQRLKGVLDHCLLAMIEKRPRYGFELIRRLDELGLLVVGEGSIYPLLSRMQNEGLIEAFIVTSDETGRKRKYYRVLPKGEEMLGELNRSWASFGGRVNAILGVEFESVELDEVEDRVAGAQREGDQKAGQAV